MNGIFHSIFLVDIDITHIVLLLDKCYDIYLIDVRILLFWSGSQICLLKFDEFICFKQIFQISSHIVFSLYFKSVKIFSKQGKL